MSSSSSGPPAATVPGAKNQAKTKQKQKPDATAGTPGTPSIDHDLRLKLESKRKLADEEGLVFERTPDAATRRAAADASAEHTNVPQRSKLEYHGETTAAARDRKEADATHHDGAHFGDDVRSGAIGGLGRVGEGREGHLERERERAEKERIVLTPRRTQGQKVFKPPERDGQPEMSQKSEKSESAKAPATAVIETQTSFEASTTEIQTQTSASLTEAIREELRLDTGDAVVVKLQAANKELLDKIAVLEQETMSARARAAELEALAGDAAGDQRNSTNSVSSTASTESTKLEKAIEALERSEQRNHALARRLAITTEDLCNCKSLIDDYGLRIPPSRGAGSGSGAAGPTMIGPEGELVRPGDGHAKAAANENETTEADNGELHATRIPIPQPGVQVPATSPRDNASTTPVGSALWRDMGNSFARAFETVGAAVAGTTGAETAGSSASTAGSRARRFFGRDRQPKTQINAWRDSESVREADLTLLENLPGFEGNRSTAPGSPSSKLTFEQGLVSFDFEQLRTLCRELKRRLMAVAAERDQWIATTNDSLRQLNDLQLLADSKNREAQLLQADYDAVVESYKRLAVKSQNFMREVRGEMKGKMVGEMKRYRQQMADRVLGVFQNVSSGSTSNSNSGGGSSAARGGASGTSSRADGAARRERRERAGSERREKAASKSKPKPQEGAAAADATASVADSHKSPGQETPKSPEQPPAASASSATSSKIHKQQTETFELQQPSTGKGGKPSVNEPPLQKIETATEDNQGASLEKLMELGAIVDELTGAEAAKEADESLERLFEDAFDWSTLGGGGGGAGGVAPDLPPRQSSGASVGGSGNSSDGGAVV